MINTQFTTAKGVLSLRRFPHTKNTSLQAWDAADEYLINYLDENNIAIESPVCIINDEFGALTCSYADFVPLNVNDSWLSQIAIQTNLKNNNLDNNIKFIDPALMLISEKPLDTVLIKIPKTTALLEHQLIKLQSQINQQTKVIAAGKVTQITKSVLSLFEKYIGETRTSLAHKKSRLIFTKPAPRKPAISPFPTIVKDKILGFDLYNHANVFCREQLDIGARFLLGHLPDKHKQVIDLGSGNGVLGISYLLQNPKAFVHFVDESYMAIQSAKESVSNTGLSNRCEYYVSHCLKNFPKEYLDNIDLILCNPPFHQKNAIMTDIAWQMFKDAKNFLSSNGELLIVANRQLNYRVKLVKLFDSVNIVARNNKFTIYSCTRRKP